MKYQWESTRRLDGGNYEKMLRNLGYVEATKILPKTATENDYMIATSGQFEMISQNDFENIDAEEINPEESYSSYKVKDGILYRKSNHWGRLASVDWSMKGIPSHLVKRNIPGGALYYGNFYGKIELSKLVRTDKAIVRSI